MTKVLVIDDSPSEMVKFREMLANFTMFEATNGEMGIKMAAEHLPDVILMDVVMPEMNGFQATRKITRNPKTSHIPVIIVSTKNQETDRVWGKRQGAKEYLTKPVDRIELLKVIQSVGITTGSVSKKPTKEQPPEAEIKSATKSSAKPKTAQATANVQSQAPSAQPATQSNSSSKPVVPPMAKTAAASNKPDEPDENGIYL